MKGAVYVNGTIASANDAVVPVYDHGFLYGEGVYETLRTYNRVPFLLDRHTRRLRASAEHLRLDVPFDDETLARKIARPVPRAPMPQVRWRVDDFALVRSSGGSYFVEERWKLR